jgi:DNA-binding CsgD family transcriptional regulator
MTAMARQAARQVEQRLRGRGSDHQRLLHEHFVRARRRGGAPVILVGAETLFSNAAAARLVTAGDRADLWAWASAAGESDRQLQLRSGQSVMATCEPVLDGTELIGVLLRISTARSEGIARESPRNVATSRARSGWSGLTATELAIAERAAEGCTNREIAAQFFLSPHTIDSHIRHIYWKLGITSRVELTRMMLSADRPRAAGSTRQ